MHSYAQLQEALCDADKKSAVDRLHTLFPHKSKSYFNRNYLYIKQLDPIGLSRALGYSDPTADEALYNIEKEKAEKEKDRQRCNADGPRNL